MTQAQTSGMDMQVKKGSRMSWCRLKYMFVLIREINFEHVPASKTLPTLMTTVGERDTLEKEALAAFCTCSLIPVYR